MASPKPKPMTEQEYQNRRSWLIDTAETPQDKKNLKSDLAKLDAQYKMQQKQGTQPDHAVTSKPNSVKPLAMPDNSTKPMSKEDAAAKKKYGSKSWNNGYTN